MATTIIAGSTTIKPNAVERYEAARTGGTIVHPILGRTSPDVTLRPARMRSGELALMFTSETAARTAFNALSGAVVASLTSTDRAIAMSFVVPEGREIRVALDPSTQAHWHLTVPFQEVTA